MSEGGFNRDLDLKNDRYYRERRKRVEHNLTTENDRWVDHLKGETFESYHFPLSYEEALSITMYYRVKGLRQKRFKFEEKHQTHIDNIQKRIQKEMDKHPHKDGYFVRLGSRSPKDACLFDGQGLACCKKMKQMLYEYFRKIHIEDDGKPRDEKDTIENREYCSLMKAACYCLSAANSGEAMEMLLNSERVYVDLLLILDFKDIFEKHPATIVIRKWITDLPYRNEFRGFVYKGKLNCLSQYDNYCYFPKLVKEKEMMGKVCKVYFDEKISPMLSKHDYSNYVIDIGVKKDGTPMVIELNSFDDSEDSAKKGTGSGCFHWKKDWDRLVNGPFEFRVTEKPPFTKIETQVCPDWMQFIYKIRRIVLKEKEELKKQESESYCSVM